jgi:hypothetical protein
MKHFSINERVLLLSLLLMPLLGQWGKLLTGSLAAKAGGTGSTILSAD